MASILEILIKFGLDDSKAKEAVKEIEQVGVASVKASTDGSKATEKHTEKTQGINKAVNLLGNQFGELGRIMNFIFSPAALGIAAVAIGIQKIKEMVDQYKAALLERAAETAAVWEAQRKGAAEAANAAHDYATAIADIAKSTDSLKTSEDAEVTRLGAIYDARKKILELLKQQELATAGGDKAKEAEIERRYGATFSAEEAAKEQEEINIKKRDLEKAKAEARAALAKANATNTAASSAIPGADEAAEAAARYEARKSKSAELIAEATKFLGGRTLAELKKEADSESEIAKSSETGTTPAIIQYQNAARAVAARDKNKAELDAAAKAVADYEQRKRDVQGNASSALSDLKAKDQDVQQRARELALALQLQGIHKVERGTEAAGNFANAQGGAAVDLFRAGFLMDASKAGQRLDASQRAQLKAAFDMLHGNAQNAEAIKELLARANDDIQGLKAALRAMQHQPGTP